MAVTPEQLARSGTEHAEQSALFQPGSKETHVYKILHIPIPEKIKKYAFDVNNAEARKLARSLGEVRFQGSECIKCGGSERYSVNNRCVKCHCEEVKIRYASNDDCRNKHIASNRKRWAENKDELNKKRNEKRKINPDHIKSVVKKWRDNNSDKLLIYNYKHKKRRSELTKRWCENNPERYKAILYKALDKRKAIEYEIGGKVSSEVKFNLFVKQSGICYWCFEKLDKIYHIDHVIPISRGGDNSETNIVVCCKSCNSQKSNKLVEEWLKAPDCRSKRK